MRSRMLMLRERDDSGFTIIELMVATLMASIVLFAALSVLDNVTKNERGQQVRHSAMLEIRQAMTQFTRDLREATWIDPASTHSVLKMKTLDSGTEIAVWYELADVGGDLYELRRKTGTVDGVSGSITWSVTATPLVTHMVVGTTALPDPPFCYSYFSAGAPSECIDTGAPPAELSAIRVTLAKDPEHNPGEPITLATDVQLRNI